MIDDFSKYWRAVEVNFKGVSQIYLLFKHLPATSFTCPLPHSLPLAMSQREGIALTNHPPQPMLLTLTLLPSMRARKSGCIITIASRAATVDTMLGLGYNDAKAAVTRATSCLQLELDLDGLGDSIHTYALHPGGVYTAMGASAHSPDVLAKYPQLFEMKEGFKELFRDKPELCGGVCAWLAAGRGRELRGCYVDCRQDLDVLVAYGRERLEQEGLMRLGVGFCEGYGNEP